MQNQPISQPKPLTGAHCELEIVTNWLLWAGEGVRGRTNLQFAEVPETLTLSPFLAQAF